jgi:uncharacterized protein YabN with tetrapyrrole methylase and pyrophosphatase domain
LKVENNADKANKTAEIILAVPGDDIVVKKTSQVLKKVWTFALILLKSY